MSELSVNNLLGIKYITEEDIQLIFFKFQTDLIVGGTN